ncbi:hypothetical protein D3C84_787190 [compost metagenome]
MVQRFEPFDVTDHLLKRLRLQRRFRESRMSAGGFQCAAPAQHKTHPERVSRVEQQVAGLRCAVGVIEVMVIGAGRYPRQQQLGHA